MSGECEDLTTLHLAAPVFQHWGGFFSFRPGVPAPGQTVYRHGLSGFCIAVIGLQTVDGGAPVFQHWGRSFVV